MPTVNVQNTETLKLYKNQYLYNGSRYQYLMTGRTDNVSFETWLGNPDYSKQVYYKSISEPILINEAINNCDEYTYGSITVSSKDDNNQDVVKTYYFFVDNISTDAYKQTTINYTIDWWTTNWTNLTCTKAHITRKPVKPLYMEQPFTPLQPTSTSSSLTSDFCIMATYIPSLGEDKPSYICNIVIPGTWENLRMVEQGYWYQYYNIPGADIKDSFIVPLFSYGDIGRTGISQDKIYVVRGALVDTDGQIISGAPVTFINEWKERYGEGVYTDILVHTEENDMYVNVSINTSSTPPLTLNSVLGAGSELAWTEYQEFVFKIVDNEEVVIKMSMVNGENLTYPNTKPLNATFTSTDKEKQGIMDWNGNLIWECPYGVTINSFTVRLETGLSHVFLKFLSNNKQEDLLTNVGFTYDCRHPGLFVDSYQDYVLKNREYDIQMRKIQSEKQEVQAWSSVAENIGFGMAFGQVKGAQAAGIGGVIEAVSTTLINQVYDPQIQKQYDKHFALMTDQISIIGDTLTPLYFFPPFSKYSITMDTQSANRMKEDVENNGYVCDEITHELSTLFTHTNTPNTQDNFSVKPVFQADNVVVEGACNVIGKQQVVRRLQNGVEFI